MAVRRYDPVIQTHLQRRMQAVTANSLRMAALPSAAKYALVFQSWLVLASPAKVGREAAQACSLLAEDRQTSAMLVEPSGGWRPSRAGPANLRNADEASRREVANL